VRSKENNPTFVLPYEGRRYFDHTVSVETMRIVKEMEKSQQVPLSF
jgi:hypothetical protein